MVVWASIVALVLGALTYFSGEAATVLRALAELGGVFALFALVCAAEAFN
jgi:hypothetical protein